MKLVPLDAEELSMEEAIRFGSAAGAIAVTRRGVQDSLPTKEEIRELLMHSQG
jgi:sugar/nucleoside kinase (ribokinase family)